MVDPHDNSTTTTPTVVVTVEGGVVQHIECPDGVRAVVKDYDTDGCDETDLSKDENGDQFVESIWE